MKILLISDTHRQINRVSNVLQNTPDITNVIHLGDMVSDAENLQEIHPDKAYHKIKGNNDWNSFTKDWMILSLCGHNIFATHGHLFGVRSDYTKLANYAKSMGCDLAVFGHTHIYADTVINGVRCLNPSNNGYFIITDDNIDFYKY